MKPLSEDTDLLYSKGIVNCNGLFPLMTLLYLLFVAIKEQVNQILPELALE